MRNSARHVVSAACVRRQDSKLPRIGEAAHLLCHGIEAAALAQCEGGRAVEAADRGPDSPGLEVPDAVEDPAQEIAAKIASEKLGHQAEADEFGLPGLPEVELREARRNTLQVEHIDGDPGVVD